MKKLKSNILTLVCALCAAVSLTSCLNDNGNENTWTPPTAAEKALACAETSGVYEGRIYFQNSSTSKKDSLQFNYSVNDSTVVFNAFPVKFLSNYVSDTNNKAVLAGAPDATLKCKNALYSITKPSSASVGNYYTFSFYPDYTTLKYSYSFNSEVTDGAGITTSKKHEVTIQFMSYVSLSGYYYTAASAYYDKRMQANFCIQQVTVDGAIYSINSAFGMIGKKGGFSEGE